MSKIAADNLRAMTDGVETPMKYPVRGSAKALLNLNGSGTIASRSSLNVSSLTDFGVGTYAKNLTSAFAAATYVSLGSTYPPSSTSNGERLGFLSYTTTFVQFRSSTFSTSYDLDTIFTASFGALA